MNDWGDELPIYKQLSQRIIGQIADGIWPEGSMLPSVRGVAADLKINHLTVMKGYQQLVDQGFIEKKRGQGMVVLTGAVEMILKSQKQHFLDKELPELAEKLNRIGLSAYELVQALEQYRIR
ncbi:GntR family transcriptional regulator [Photobacterium sagamiensis]|uniref:GntR family transcriptional regulator n=1 Tax=Photobacterium sagamiensis TaxID=2910241 RepID=UPI003D12A52E